MSKSKNGTHQGKDSQPIKCIPLVVQERWSSDVCNGPEKLIANNYWKKNCIKGV